VALEAILAAGERWGKRELALWLLLPYRSATDFFGDDDEAPPASMSRGSVVQDEAVRSVVRAARAAALEARERPSAAAASLVAQAKAAGWIVPVCDAKGARGFAPRAAGALTLTERLLALLVVGHLAYAAPEDTPVSGIQRCMDRH